MRLNGKSVRLAITAFLFGLLHAAAAAEERGDVEKGRHAIERYGCVACHTVPGVHGPRGDVGPPLEHMARRTYIAGVLANTEENMVRWLRNPPAVDPRTAMPNVNMSEAEARDIAAYLSTLD